MRQVTAHIYILRYYNSDISLYLYSYYSRSQTLLRCQDKYSVQLANESLGAHLPDFPEFIKQPGGGLSSADHTVGRSHYDLAS